jgi:hypothetical protein
MNHHQLTIANLDDPRVLEAIDLDLLLYGNVMIEVPKDDVSIVKQRLCEFYGVKQEQIRRDYEAL